MKLFLIISAVITAILAEAPASSGPYPPSTGPNPDASGPYPPSGWKPSGRLLTLPSRQQAYGAPAPQPPAEYGPPQPEYGAPQPGYGPPDTEAAATPEPPTDQPEDLPQESEQLVDNGVYYVLQPNGKLQMVRYTTAPLKKKQPFQQQRFGDASSFNSQRAQPDKFQQQKQSQLSQVQAHQAQFQYRPVQPQPSAPFHYVEVQRSVEVPVVVQPSVEEPEVGYVANVQYRDVEPISAPIYAYNPTPLVRILKK